MGGATPKVIRFREKRRRIDEKEGGDGECKDGLEDK